MVKFILYLWLIIVLALIPCVWLSLKYRNKHKLYFVFGKKGAGKTTMLTKLAYKYNKKGVKVYCNTEIPGTCLIDAKDVGFYKFEENSVVMIDEVSLIWDNRNFKNFRPEVAKFFRLQRHHKLTVWLFIQPLAPISDSLRSCRSGNRSVIGTYSPVNKRFDAATSG